MENAVLESLIAKMDVPTFRRDTSRPDNTLWLVRNLGIRNSEQANYKEVMAALLVKAREQNKVSAKEALRMTQTLYPGAAKVLPIVPVEENS